MYMRDNPTFKHFKDASKFYSQEDIFESLPVFESKLRDLDKKIVDDTVMSDLKRQTLEIRQKCLSLLDPSKLRLLQLGVTSEDMASEHISKTTSHTADIVSKQQQPDVEFGTDSHVAEVSSTNVAMLRKDSHDLHIKKQRLLEEYQTLEHRKYILDAKERIIFQELQSIRDPQVLRILSYIETKFSELAQEREYLSELKNTHAQKSKQLLDKEARVQHMQQEVLARKRKIDSEVIHLQTIVTDLKSQRDTLEDQRLHLDALVRERSQLISDLDLQFHDTKSELKKLQQQVESERALLGSTRESIESNERELDQARKDFEIQKKQFYENISELSEESRREVEEYKSKVLHELQEQAAMLRDQEKHLNVKEQMLHKLDSEIHKREIRLSDSLSSLEHERNALVAREAISASLSVAPPPVQVPGLVSAPTFPDQNIPESSVHSGAPTQTVSSRTPASKKSAVVYPPPSSEMIALDLQRLLNDLDMAIVEGDLKSARSLYATAYALYNTAPALLREKFEIPLKELYYKFNS